MRQWRLQRSLEYGPSYSDSSTWTTQPQVAATTHRSVPTAYAVIQALNCAGQVENPAQPSEPAEQW